MIVESKRDLIYRLHVKRFSLKAIAARASLSIPAVRERLIRMGRLPKTKLKSVAQRAALTRLRNALGRGKRNFGSAYIFDAAPVRKPRERRRPSTLMIVWRGFDRETEVQVRVRDCGVGAGLTTCIECRGARGFVFEADWEPCVECKATGKVFVSI